MFSAVGGEEMTSKITIEFWKFVLIIFIGFFVSFRESNRWAHRYFDANNALIEQSRCIANKCYPGHNDYVAKSISVNCIKSCIK